MAIVNSIKGVVVKQALKTMLDGDKGSTMLGTVAAALLTAGIDWSKLMQGPGTADGATEIGKIVGVVLLVLWGLKAGKKPVEK